MINHEFMVGAPEGQEGVRYYVRVLPVLVENVGRELKRADGTTTELMATINVPDEINAIAAEMLESIKPIIEKLHGGQ